MGERMGAVTHRAGGTPGRTPVVAANWKMNHTVAEARRFAEELLPALQRGSTAGSGNSACDVVICPPFTSIPVLSDLLAGSGVAIGAQNLYWEASGAFTGEISAGMLADLGCEYVIVGHSERRTLFGESDADVRRKLEAALARGIVPIVCVGETADERDAGNTHRVIAGQIEVAVQPLSPDEVGRLVIAYEPVWAIGTGATATADDANEAIGSIRGVLRAAKGEAAASARIQYGGSVKESNVAAFAAQPDIDGALVGGASLEAASFANIVHGWGG